jgi:hypothetical protein
MISSCGSVTDGQQDSPNARKQKISRPTLAHKLTKLASKTRRLLPRSHLVWSAVSVYRPFWVGKFEQTALSYFHKLLFF